ncbi:sigma factor [Virgibacillus sp. DJP39]|uniref:sigma factor n=1 Tax=Virgibacillus sp. DJP39 TaxID=3409790 RepID=UPI003BB73A6D
MTFYDVALKFEKMINFHIHDLNMEQPYDEYFQDGLFVLWQAYKTLDPQKGEFSTYLNCNVRNKLLDMKKQETNHAYTGMLLRQSLLEQFASKTQPKSGPCSWKALQPKMTVNKWKWIYHYIILDHPCKSLANTKTSLVDGFQSWFIKSIREFRKNNSLID